MTSQPSLPFAVASVNEEAVFWLNATPAQRTLIQKAGGSVPTITQDDRYVAAQRAAAQAAAPQQP